VGNDPTNALMKQMLCRSAREIAIVGDSCPSAIPAGRDPVPYHHHGGGQKTLATHRVGIYVPMAQPGRK
jgi:hypothetical protein